MREGQRVSYLGSNTSPSYPGFGDNGRVVQGSGTYCHILWSTGRLKNMVSLVEGYDLAPVGKQSSLVEDDLVDSLDVGGLVSTATREIYDTGGTLGLLTAMADAGHLSGFQDIADEALTLIESRLRKDPSFKAVTSSLEDDEVDSLIKASSFLILRDSIALELD